jgi:hypothetical protein
LSHLLIMYFTKLEFMDCKIIIVGHRYENLVFFCAIDLWSLNMLKDTVSDTTKKKLGIFQSDDLWKITKVEFRAIKCKTYQLTRNFIQRFRDDPRNISMTVDYNCHCHFYL